MLKLRAHNSSPADNARIVTNLDRLVAEPVGVMLLGKRRIVKPITTEQFLKLSRELAAIDMLRMKAQTEPLDEKEVVEKYSELFKIAVEPFSGDDMNKMTYPQMAALFQVILDCVGGKAQVEDEKKNVNQTPTGSRAS